MIIIDNFFRKIERIFHSKFISRRWLQNIANKYVDVFIADKISRNFGVLLTTVLCTLGLPQKIPG